jgi:tetratricopeptide (TPR) repeat protein
MFLFPAGDRQRGLRELRRAADSARYAGIEASYFLMQVLQNYEHRYEEAMNIAARLSTRFPHNVIFQKYVGRCAASLGRWEEMQQTWSDVLRRVNEGKPGYTPNVEREAQYYLAQYAMETGSTDSALAHLYRCDELSRKLDSDEPSGFMIIANLRIGMLYDLQMKRELALQQYDKVLKLNEYMNSRKQAEEYIKVPYKKN